VGGAESYASLAVNTVLFLTAYSVGFLVVEMRIVGALVNANFATYAALLVSFNEVFGYYVGFHCITPPARISEALLLLLFSLATTGSPPLGHQNLSRLGETNRIADSSEDK
jgi:uncharacterized paraquat-inducible protein A